MRDKLAAKNSIITFLCQIFDLALGFISRKIFIAILGVEVLGISSTFISLLNTLSLAELGFESAVIYNLYKPMKDGDKSRVEDIVIILKRVYECVGAFVFLTGVIMSFFLSAILKGVDVDKTITLAFYIQLIGTSSTYFLAYKRTFLLALQKDYIRNLIISAVKIISVIVQIFSMLVFKSFILYIFISTAQNILTNLLIGIYVDKTTQYNFHHRKLNLSIFRGLFSNVKDIFFSKLAGYIYSSTDNIIISSIVSTISVGFLGNYTQILYQMKSVLSNVFSSTKPIIGHYLTAENDKNHSLQILKNYTFIRYVSLLLLFVPGYVLCDCFIESWIGANFVMSKSISILLVSDIYIHFVHGALVDYISGLGLFQHDRNISIIGAIINLVVSICLVNLIGIPGVLIGTVVAQVYFWISRSVIVFCKYFKDLKSKFVRYWLDCVSYTIVFYALCLLLRFLFDVFPMNNSYLKFIIGGILCETAIVLVVIVIYGRTKEFSYSLGIVKALFKKFK